MYDLTFQKFEEADFEQYFLLVSNEDVMRMITERPITLEEAQENFRKIIERNSRYELFGTYKIYHETKGFIGLGSLILNEEKKEEAEIGYMLLPPFWGKGYGSEIAKASIQKAKSTNIKRLTAVIDPNNIASKKILLKNGFHSEQVCEIDGLPGEILSRMMDS